MLADTAANVGVAGGLFLLVLLLAVWWTGRDRRYRKVRFGVFLERDRWDNNNEGTEDDGTGD